MLNLFEKYSVKNFSDFDEEISEKYKTIINVLSSITTENLPNMILCGNPGSGKKSLLCSFFKNTPKEKYINEYKHNSKIFEYITYRSNQFLELDIYELFIYKKYILKNIIKDYVKTKRVFDNKNKIIIMHNVQLLSVDDQFVLRKIMEDNIKNCRFILLSNSINNLLEPIKSRCMILKIPGFTKEIIKNKLEKIIYKEKIKIDDETINKIVTKSKNNLKKAILDLNTYNNLNKNGHLGYFDINNDKIYKEILEILKKSPAINYERMDKLLYDLITEYNKSPHDVINDIYDIIVLEYSFSNERLEKLIDLNFEYSLKVSINTKYIIYLQAYVLDLVDYLK